MGLLIVLIGVAAFVIVSAAVMLSLRDRGEKRRKRRDEQDDEQW